MGKLEQKRSASFKAPGLPRPLGVFRRLYGSGIGEPTFFAGMTVNEARCDVSLDQVRELAKAKIRRERLPPSMRLKVAIQVFYDDADIYCPDPNGITQVAVYRVRVPRREKKVDVSESVLLEFLRDCYYSPRPKDEPRYPDVRIQWEDLPWHRHILRQGIRVFTP